MAALVRRYGPATLPDPIEAWSQGIRTAVDVIHRSLQPIYIYGSQVLCRWFDVHACRIGKPDQHRVAILFSDISGRCNVELALEEAEARFREMAEHPRWRPWSPMSRQLHYLDRALRWTCGKICLPLNMPYRSGCIPLQASSRTLRPLAHPIGTVGGPSHPAA